MKWKIWLVLLVIGSWLYGFVMSTVATTYFGGSYTSFGKNPVSHVLSSIPALLILVGIPLYGLLFNVRQLRGSFRCKDEYCPTKPCEICKKCSKTKSPMGTIYTTLIVAIAIPAAFDGACLLGTFQKNDNARATGFVILILTALIIGSLILVNLNRNKP